MSGIIQIAGIMNQEEARMLMECGADWLAFPLRLAFHKEDLTQAEAARIIRKILPPHHAVLITYLQRPDDVVTLCRELGVRKVQLHGSISASNLRCLRDLDRGLFVIKSLVVRNDNQAEVQAMLREAEPYVDAFITDTYDPETGASGATGKTHNWKVSRKLVEVSSRPVILAGGLTSENVALAIREVQPAGVDAHTGVEGADGRKRIELVRAFVNEARKAFNAFSRTPGFE